MRDDIEEAITGSRFAGGSSNDRGDLSQKFWSLRANIASDGSARGLGTIKERCLPRLYNAPVRP